MKKIIITLLLGLLAFTPALTLAGPEEKEIIEIDLQSFASNITDTVVSIFFIVAVLGMIAAAFMFLTAGGDSEKTKKAKSMLVSAIIAITIGVLAYSVKPTIKNFLKNQGSSTSIQTELVV